MGIAGSSIASEPAEDKSKQEDNIPVLSKAMKKTHCEEKLKETPKAKRSLTEAVIAAGESGGCSSSERFDNSSMASSVSSSIQSTSYNAAISYETPKRSTTRSCMKRMQDDAVVKPEPGPKKTKHNSHESIPAPIMVNPIPSQLVLRYRYTAKEDTMERDLAEAMFRVANNYLKHVVIQKAWDDMKLIRDTKKIGTCLTINFIPSEKGEFAYAWMDGLTPRLHTVMIDRSFLTRYSFYGCTANEKIRIEFFCGLKLIHEVIHLAWRWTNGKHAMTPEKYACESGETFENVVFNGLLGFTYNGKNEWGTEQQEITALFLHKTPNRHLIDNEFINQAHADCLAGITENLLPLKYDMTPFKGSKNMKIV